MYLTKIEVKDFLTIAHLSLPLAPINLICGSNWSGKTSTQQAMRLALTGQVARVSLKGDWKTLVRDNAKSATVVIETDQGPRSAKIKRADSGHEVPQDAVIWPVLLDQDAFAAAKPETRLQILSDVLGLMPKPDKVRAMMIERGVSEADADHVAPFLTTGWDAALRAAEQQVTEARARWKAVAGETYGSEKAATWTAPADGLEDDRTKAADLAKHRERLELARKALTEYQPEVRQAEQELAGYGATHACTACGNVDALVTEERAAELRLTVPKMREALSLLETAVLTRERDVQASTDAAERLSTAAQRAEGRTTTAAAAHASVQAWTKIVEMLKPTGIPSELLAGPLKTLNQRLAWSAGIMERLGCAVPSIANAGDIYFGERMYGLCSKAEQWLCRAMILEAMTTLSGKAVLVLDEMDILQTQKRGPFVEWMKAVANEGTQVIVFATLKTAPTIKGIQVVWLQDGAAANPQTGEVATAA